MAPSLGEFDVLLEVVLSLVRVGKTGPAHSFPTLTTVSINLVQKLGYLCGENLGWSVTFPP